MQKSIWLFVLMLTLGACGPEETTPEAPDQATMVPEIPVETITLDPASSQVVWERHKEWKNMESSFKLGKSTINFTMDNAKINTSGSFGVKSGSWQVKEGQILSGEVEVDLANIVALQVDDDEMLKLKSPDYLDIEKYPTATIKFGEVQVPADSLAMPVELTLKGKTENVDALVSSTVVDGKPFLMMANFSIQGVEWDLIPEDKVKDVVTDSLVFQCGFQTGPDAPITNN